MAVFSNKLTLETSCHSTGLAKSLRGKLQENTRCFENNHTYNLSNCFNCLCSSAKNRSAMRTYVAYDTRLSYTSCEPHNTTITLSVRHKSELCVAVETEGTNARKKTLALNFQGVSCVACHHTLFCFHLLYQVCVSSVRELEIRRGRQRAIEF